jgi:plastocyanin domain-containing protein
MDTAIWVTIGGVGLAIAVNLYFFSPRRAVVAAPAVAEGPQVVRVRVRDGYDPARIEVRAGRPVRLLFRRDEVEGCSDTVLIPEWGITQRLPAWEETLVEFTPRTPGEFEFTCGMHMLRGSIVVTPGLQPATAPPPSESPPPPADPPPAA